MNIEIAQLIVGVNLKSFYYEKQSKRTQSRNAYEVF